MLKIFDKNGIAQMNKNKIEMLCKLNPAKNGSFPPIFL